MKVLALDFETTGVDPKTCRPIEYCFSVWDTETDETNSISGYMWDSSYPKIPEEITKLTGITPEMVATKHEHPRVILDRLCQSALQLDLFVAHNAHGFDKVVLEAECYRHSLAIPKIHWLDTMTDIEYPQRVKCRKLSHLALEHGIPVDPAKLHGAAMDTQLVLAILKQYPVEELAELAKSPWKIAKAEVSYQDREHAKKAGFSWERLGEQVFTKSWVKKIRESRWDAELEKCPFKVTELL